MDWPTSMNSSRSSRRTIGPLLWDGPIVSAAVVFACICRTEQSVAANIAHLPPRHGAQRAVIHTAPAVGPTTTHRGSDTLSKGDCWLMGRGIGVLATFAFGRQV